MFSRTRRPVTAAAVVTAATLAVTGCANGFDAATNVEYVPAEGVSLSTENAGLRNVTVVSDPGKPTSLGATLVHLDGEADRLLSVEIGDPAVRGTITGPGVTGGRLALPRNRTVVIGAEGGPQVTFDGAEVTPGSWVPVTFLLDSGETAGDALVVTTVLATKTPETGTGSAGH